MLLELAGVLFLLYNELYSRKNSDIENFNKELDVYCDYYIDRNATYNSEKLGREINRPENKGIGISDLELKLLKDDSDYKANNNRVLKNKEAKEKNRIPFSHYFNYKNKAKHLLKYFLVPNSEPVNKGSLSIYSGHIPPPAYPTLPEIPMLKNSILVLGYYLILNGFALQLICQIFKDYKESCVNVESSTKINIGSNENVNIDTFKIENISKIKIETDITKPNKIN